MLLYMFEVSLAGDKIGNHPKPSLACCHATTYERWAREEPVAVRGTLVGTKSAHLRWAISWDILDLGHGGML